MKKSLSIILSFVLLLVCCLPAVYATDEQITGVSYYIDSIDGSDETGDGLSPQTAWKNVPVTQCTLSAGDKVLFRRGGVYECTLTVSGSRGTPDAPILISSYGEGELPLLTTDQPTEVLRLFDCSNVIVSDLELTAHNGGGIWIDALEDVSEDITLDSLVIHDIQNHTVTARDGLHDGAATARACVMVKGLPARSLFPVNGLDRIELRDVRLRQRCQPVGSVRPEQGQPLYR